MSEKSPKKSLFVIVVPLQFDNKHINLIIVDTIYYAVVGGNPTRISDAAIVCFVKGGGEIVSIISY